MRHTLFPLGLTTTSTLLIGLGLAACDGPAGKAGGAQATATATTSASAEGGGADVLVTVNGVPIRVSDLHYVLAKERKGRGPAGEAEAKAALDQLIDQELARQQAEAMGLHRDPEYLRKLRFMEAPVNDFKRRELRDSFFRKKVATEAAVSEAEAKRYFEDNRQRFQTVVTLHKILVRGDDAKLEAMKAQIDGGTPFDEVAAQLFPKDLPESPSPPWAVGPLRWHQVPAPFIEPLAKMKEGDVSGIIRGPKERAWIIKLVKRQVDESITFESVKGPLSVLLRDEKAAEVRKETLETLREGATIERRRPAEAMPPPPDPD